MTCLFMTSMWHSRHSANATVLATYAEIGEAAPPTFAFGAEASYGKKRCGEPKAPNARMPEHRHMRTFRNPGFFFVDQIITRPQKSP